MEEYFVLDEAGAPRREHDLDAWTRWFETADRGLARTVVMPHVIVLTTFVGVHEPGKGPEDEAVPRLFESRVFGGVLDGEAVATRTRAEALAAHGDLAEWCRIGNSPDAGITEDALI